MSHTTNLPPAKYATSDLPTDLPEGTVAYDITNQKMVAFKQGAWGDLGGAAGIGSTTYVRENVAGVIDQIQGDIPESWKSSDTSLKGLVIGTSCTSIGSQAIRNCSGLTGNLVIPDSVTTIGESAFNNCSGLTGALTIPNNVTVINNNTFQSCGFNGTLTIPNSVTTIGVQAFEECGFNGALIIPNSVTRIGDHAFFLCTGFTGTLTIPDSVTIIESSAFSTCSGLTKAIVPSSVAIMGSGVFGFCTNMITIDCYVTKSTFDDGNSTLFNSGVTTIHVRSTDTTWTAGAGQTIGGKAGITVIKDL